ncbi:mechanosensitive ion channel family protein [Zeaxanthinibacter enoshimensis]|uniref:Small conductance mechanosensitive channel n=1 Tax=Zeaxanthinibacter enoshimensis TaxID=392009 RepID=A0A4R6TWA4_9FLAO|nr:mechanosensitive ion channel family protein [Zeaxanthinibacter enoshimensis]TDQ33238.1 small conductance mechanosensitive channel [Zeaxanthinibacter enoshimensis]
MFKLSDAWNKMLDKLESWIDALVLGLPNFVMAVLVFIIVLILSKYISNVARKLLDRSKLQDSMKHLISRIVAVVIIIFGLFLVLGILNLSKALNTILAGAGVVGLAVGLALQGALSNTYSGIILSYVKYVKFGDWIESNGFAGEVVEIDLRSVTLKQPDNNMVYIPNKLVVENPIKNFSTTSQSRVILHCGVGYDSDLSFVRDLVKKTISDKFDGVDRDDVIFLYNEFGDSSINFETRFWIDSTKALDIHKARTEAMIAIKSAFDKEGIEIPFPIRTLDFPESVTISKQDKSSE